MCSDECRNKWLTLGKQVSLTSPWLPMSITLFLEQVGMTGSPLLLMEQVALRAEPALLLSLSSVLILMLLVSLCLHGSISRFLSVLTFCLRNF